MSLMDYLVLGLIAVGLAADTFAVSVARSIPDKKFLLKKSLTIALYFGFFQGMMLIIGWFLGSQVLDLVSSIDHWIALALLCFIGGKMIYESRVLDQPDGDIDQKTLLILSVATSIDALAIGLSFSFLKVAIFEAVIIVGVLTFLLSILGCFLGRTIGHKIKSKAEIFGGIILILIGIKILLEHLGFL